MPRTATRQVAGAPDPLGRADFARLAAFIYDTTGIKMPDNKIIMLESRLRRRVRATGSGTIAGYCDWLFAHGNLAEETTFLINAVTTNKTDFFRESHHFDYLSDTILPAMKAAGTDRIRVWSAGCSTGAEPYTIAMLLDAFASDRRGPDFGILATDIDTDVLDVARRGIFHADTIDVVPPALRNRYIAVARARGREDVRMAPDLRAAIGFARLNLMDDVYPVGDAMDLIFCRNVLIYFDRETQERVVRKLVACLRPGGHLFLGHAESIAGIDLPLVAVANTVFQRT
ncbi:MAG TPA: CheR family methyltransferase [Sphingomonas sp.]|nr:CheR family methyltransferase [Sphingomonas sp.]